MTHAKIMKKAAKALEKDAAHYEKDAKRHGIKSKEDARQDRKERSTIGSEGLEVARQESSRILEHSYASGW